MECGALPEFALEPDASALHFNEALGDVQSQTGSGNFTAVLDGQQRLTTISEFVGNSWDLRKSSLNAENQDYILPHF